MSQDEHVENKSICDRLKVIEERVGIMDPAIEKVIFEIPDLDKSRVHFFQNIDSYVLNLAKDKNIEIKNLHVALQYAAGFMSTMDSFSDMTPEEMYEKLLTMKAS